MRLTVRQRFRRWTKTYPDGMDALARAIGCSRAFLYMLMSEKKGVRRKPKWAKAKIIESLSGIPAQDWMVLPTDKRVAA